MTNDITSSAFQLIPLGHLVLSPLNVRKTTGEEGIEQLSELIYSEGVIQNLSAYACPHAEGEAEARYAVIAGGRRWRALRRLLEQGRITADYPVPCLIVDYERAVEISLTENSGREPMHPADEFEAFRQLINAGQSVEDVAARFGVAPIVVQRRLKLANVDSTFIELYRQEEITLEHLMALAMTDDHARQLEVWESLKPYERTPSALRRALTEREVSLGEPIARYVGLKAYQKAGGVVHRDLFAEEDEDGVRLDGDLVRKLATEKLEKCAEKLRKEGVTWVHVSPEFDYATRAAYGRVKTVLRDPTEAEGVAIEAIATERARIVDQMDQAEDDEERVAELETRLAELESQEDAINEERQVPDAEQLVHAGALVSIGRDGKVKIDRTVLKAEDTSRFAKAARGREGATLNGAPRVHSAALVRRLTAQRTIALQATLAERPDVALVALAHRLLLRAFPLYGFGRQNAVGIEPRSAELGAYADELAGCPAETALRARCAALEEQLPKDPARLFAWLMERPQPELLSILAYCIAVTVNAVQPDESASAADEIAQAVGLDMRAWWIPTAERYLAHVPKARILEVVREAVSPEVAATLAKMKKAPLAQAAEKRLAGTGWLPALLKTGA
jgi:ParB family chromosome partitioning protein